ncbi:MAG: ATP-binding cassette domain-containing protein [Oscillospiraceae bacterium]|jgi:putative ABC transport system permease protein
MLKLSNIIKHYEIGDQQIQALKGIDIEFREHEFVSILGQSGCGKTTLLNIIGGLDQYTSGDLIINGRSTKEFKDKDWDSYRNYSIGFVFQSYNLISHQTVLSNVELALTLSGVSKSERKRRAIEALEKVGLGDQLQKKPNQMSGGQMQRVAIARALVNDPDILLADEPTGALDSETSKQVMEILKEISKEKLVIMVTHNPELAEKYSTRIVRLLDGRLISDSAPYDSGDLPVSSDAGKAIGKTSMSFFTALSLSRNNLMTKKARTLLTAFAGSIGIIGIALILALSTGVQDYINDVESSTMASYPITISANTMDFSAMMGNFMEANTKAEVEDGYVGSNDIMTQMMDSMTSMITTNNLTAFKKYLESDDCKIDDAVNDLQYLYGTGLNTYIEENDGTYTKTCSNYNEMFSQLGMETGTEKLEDSSLMMPNTAGVWNQFIGDSDYIASQYSVIYGKLPTAYNEVVIEVDENNQISDYVLYALGIRDMDELAAYHEAAENAMLSPELYEAPEPLASTRYTYEELCDYSFKVLLDTDYYTADADTGLIRDRTNSEIETLLKSDDTLTLKIVGIVKPADSSLHNSSPGGILYTEELMSTLIDAVNSSDVIAAQLDEPNRDLKTGMEFVSEYTEKDYPMLAAMIQSNGMLEYLTYLGYDVTDPADILAFANEHLATSQESALADLGYVDFSKPTAINIYPKDFESKDIISDSISDYNKDQEEEDQITYTDTVGLLLSSVTTIINAISYILIAFVSISLVVSSIMIGIITYISVLERTKEIGILRAIGASKRDISHVFNAETLIIGFVSGALGIGITLLLTIPINMIIRNITGIATLGASLPVAGAVVLVIISMLLTFIAGLFPSRIAAKKDPVVALRTE